MNAIRGHAFFLNMNIHEMFINNFFLGKLCFVILRGELI